MMTKRSAVWFVLAGIAIGCGASAVAPTMASHAQPAAGSWGCYVVDRFPDVDAAANWGKSKDIKEGLDRVARNVPAGTMVAVQPKQGTPYPSVVCVKN